MESTNTKSVSANTAGAMRKANALYRLLAGHEVMGLAPGEIAKALGVAPSWVSINMPLLAEDGFVERVADTNRWRLGVAFVRIALTVSTNLNAAKRQLEELSQRYAVPVGKSDGSVPSHLFN